MKRVKLYSVDRGMCYAVTAIETAKTYQLQLPPGADYTYRNAFLYRSTITKAETTTRIGKGFGATPSATRGVRLTRAAAVAEHARHLQEQIDSLGVQRDLLVAEKAETIVDGLGHEEGVTT